MSKKGLDEQTIVNELKGSSLYFQPSSPRSGLPPKDVARPLVVPSEGSQDQKMGEDLPSSNQPLKNDLMSTGKKESTSKQEIKKESMQASYHASVQASMIEKIRKSVKSIGKETLYIRLTPEEKNQLVDVVYTYKRQGMKTSENEINRIAINHLLEDFRLNGRVSILARVLEALLA